MGAVGQLLSTEKPPFLYRTQVDDLVLPSQGDRKNSEFDNSQVCRHDADLQGEANNSP